MEPDRLLGLNVGECFIFRTVAGHPQRALEDLAALDIETDGGVEDVMVRSLNIGNWKHVLSPSPMSFYRSFITRIVDHFVLTSPRYDQVRRSGTHRTRIEQDI